MPVRTFLLVAELVVVGAEAAAAEATRIGLFTWNGGEKRGLLRRMKLDLLKAVKNQDYKNQVTWHMGYDLTPRKAVFSNLLSLHAFPAPLISIYAAAFASYRIKDEITSMAFSKASLILCGSVWHPTPPDYQLE